MAIQPRRRVVMRPVAAHTGPRFALRCAANVRACVDRRTPEAPALATWLANYSAEFGLGDADRPDDDTSQYRRPPSVSAQDWQRVATAIGTATAKQRNAIAAPVAQWLDVIAQRLSLDPLETDILCLALHYRLDQRVERLFDVLSECRGGQTRLHRDCGLMAMMLGTTPADIEAAFAADGRLLTSGLLQVDLDGDIGVLTRLLSLIRRAIPATQDFHDLLLGTTTLAPLAWDCFAHLGREAELAAEVLRAALAAGSHGINLLLYGPPGTGKTALAASLAARIGARLRPVAEADDAGEEPSRQERLGGLRLAHRLAPAGETILLFDEAEDLFCRRDFGSAFGLDQIGTNSRVFIHRLLEQGTAPVIWTANDIGAIGPAVLRRMTMCVEMKVPNVLIRARLWRQMGKAEGVELAEADAARLARLVPAAPAVAATALRATRLVGDDAQTAHMLVEGVARAVQGGRLAVADAPLDADYDPALLNADCDLLALADRLSDPQAPRAVSFLLSGPPGTGKSAWVRHLAARMGLPVLHKRASDLLNPYVGGTEENIAGAFAEAREMAAFLVFDEADSLLLDRADAVRGWEISQVNEMLTWMEAHALPFACTTNLADRLDRASLRRFLAKIRFDWLTTAQARLAFRRFFALEPPAALDDLRMLAPADFALVRRRAAISDGTTAAGLVRLLAAECDGRVGGRAPVGFSAFGER